MYNESLNSIIFSFHKYISPTKLELQTQYIPSGSLHT